MSTTSSNITILKHDGQTQGGRIIKALQPETVSLDNKTITDFILFAKRYSEYIKFYPIENPNDRIWREFWSRDISAVLATMASFPIEDFYTFYKDLKQFIFNLIEQNPVPNDEIAKHFRLFFQLPLWLTQAMVEIDTRIKSQPQLRNQFQLILEDELSEALTKIIAYFKGADQELPVAGSFKDISIENIEFGGANDIEIPDHIADLQAGLTEFENANIELPFSSDNWTDFYNGIPADINPFVEELSIKGIVYDALNYNLLIASFESAVDAMVQAIALFKKELDKTLSQYPLHQPHYALWLCFAKLYQFQRKEINDIPRRHLEYYFEQVLKQAPLNPQAPSAFVIFELNDNIEKELISQGTLLSAGQDDEGKDLHFEILDNILVNRAVVSEIKSLYKPRSGFPIAASKTDTLDGIEEALEGDFPTWKPFFMGHSEEGNPAPQARLGFAIADKSLFLREGIRTINLAYVGANTISGRDSDQLEAYYTSEKGWEPLTITEVQNRIQLTMGVDKPPCLHFDPEVHVDDDHTDAFKTDLPIIKILVKGDYQRWASFEFDSLNLSVTVTDVKDLVIQNKDGIMDASKAFPIFGSIPDSNPSFILGNNEVFSKTLSSLKLNLEWLEAYNNSNVFTNSLDANDFDIKFDYLKGGSWNNGSNVFNNSLHPFTDDSVNHILNLDSEISSVTFNAEQELENPDYSGTSKEGFIQIQLNNDFGHSKYPLAVAIAMIATPTELDDLPNEPYTAKMNSIALDYSTTSARPQHFIELHPFGFKRNTNPNTLVPKILNEGEQYIGIEHASPEQKIHILFEVLSGTANPLADPSEIKWQYLSGNEWIDTHLEVDDTTDSFARSGVIAFTIPKSASNQNTLLASGYHWLRMSVESDIDSLNDFIGIHAQAALVSLVDKDNDPKFFETPMSEGTIAKLVITQDPIKSVNQPYPGFNQQGNETKRDYYTRVSERLRHKDRAIQMWDYEHLILQHYRHLFRVKCINHTKGDDHNKPGHVTIVPLPRIHADMKDPTQPFTDKKTRIDIYNLLKARMSPFICLHVLQPRLEIIEIEADIKYRGDIVDYQFYRDRLEQALIEFLTPWAYNFENELNFGGTWYKSDIINFIDEQPYVDYIKDVKMYHNKDYEATTYPKIDLEVVRASTARSILVSSKSHVFHEIELGTEQQTANPINCKCESKELI